MIDWLAKRQSFYLETRYRKYITCINFVGLIGLIGHSLAIVAAAAFISLLIDFWVTENKESWLVVKPLFLMPGSLLYGVLYLGLREIDIVLPGLDWPGYGIAATLVVFGGICGDFLNSLVAWADECDRQVSKLDTHNSRLDP